MENYWYSIKDNEIYLQISSDIDKWRLNDFNEWIERIESKLDEHGITFDENKKENPNQIYLERIGEPYIGCKMTHYDDNKMRLILEGKYTIKESILRKQLDFANFKDLTPHY